MAKKGSKTKAGKASKTNAARLLDQNDITYECLTYDVDPDDLVAERTAAKLGLKPNQVFKTLVVRGERTGICFAVIPGDTQLDLKALAKLSDNRKVSPVALKEVQPLTGYIRGGVTALASKKDYPVYGHSSMTTFAKIAVSAGKRGLMLWLDPQDYIQVTQATVGAIAQ
ncbi:MAG: Cys-tRNA(Pro) deacylase [Cyanobacteria bacterium P01_F01_bin.150]